MIFISIDLAAKLGVKLQYKWTWKLSLSRWLLTTIGADWKTIDNPALLVRWKSTNDHVDDKCVEIWNKGETWLTESLIWLFWLFCLLCLVFCFIYLWGATGGPSELFKASWCLHWCDLIYLLYSQRPSRFDSSDPNKCFIKHSSLHLLILNVNIVYERLINIKVKKEFLSVKLDRRRRGCLSFPNIRWFSLCPLIGSMKIKKLLAVHNWILEKKILLEYH